MSHDEIAAAYSRFGVLVHRRCRQILRDSAAAEDATQEVFLRLWRHGGSFQLAESKVGWLYRVAERCALDILRSKRRRAEVPADEAPEASLAAHGVEEWDLVRKLLGGLDDRVCRIAVLYYLDGQTQEAIAAATGWSRQTVIKKLALLRARAEKMKDALAPRSAT